MIFSVAAVALSMLAVGLGVAAIRTRAPWWVSRFALLFVAGAAVAIGLDVLVTSLGDAAHAALVIGAVVWSVIALGLGVLHAVRARRSLRPFWLMVMGNPWRRCSGPACWWWVTWWWP